MLKFARRVGRFFLDGLATAGYTECGIPPQYVEEWVKAEAKRVRVYALARHLRLKGGC